MIYACTFQQCFVHAQTHAPHAHTHPPHAHTLLYCSDENEAAQILINAGSKVNPKNHKEATPTMIAAIKGHTSVLRILVNHPNIQLADQVQPWNKANLFVPRVTTIPC